MIVKVDFGILIEYMELLKMNGIIVCASAAEPFWVGYTLRRKSLVWLVCDSAAGPS